MFGVLGVDLSGCAAPATVSDPMVADPDSDSSDGEVSDPETDIAARPELPLAPAPLPQTVEQPKVTPPPTTEQLSVTSACARARAPWRSAPVIELRARVSWRGAPVIKRRRGKRGGQGRRQTRDRLRIDVALAAAPWRRGGASDHESSL